MSGDGIDLINKAFSETNPKIRINRLESTSDINEQKGITNILRGCYQYIRNPRSHDKFEDTENDCVAILCFIDFIITKIKGSIGQFELSSFINQVIDKRFVQSKVYCEELIKEIPSRKLFDTLLEVYKVRNSIDIYNLEILFLCFYERISKSNIETFLNMISNELRTTSNDSDIKIIAKIIHEDMWNNIHPIARIRTENRIIESIKECSYLGTWCTGIFKYFKDKSGLFKAVESILYEDIEDKIYYMYKFYFKELIKLINKEMVYINDEEVDIFALEPLFIYTIRTKIEANSVIHYNGVKSILYMMPDFLQMYFKTALDNFKSIDSVQSDFPEDIPF